MAFDTDGKTFWGLAEILPGGTASRIKVYGEKKNDKYIKYAQDNTRDSFPPAGKVFAPQPVSSYYSFQVEQNSRMKEKDDEYLAVSHSCRPVKFNRLLSIEKLENPSSFPLEEIQKIRPEIEAGTYFIKNKEANELLGPFRMDSKGLSPKTGKEVSVYEIPDDFNDYLFDGDKLLFTAADGLLKKKKEIDCMSNEQLQEWFREKIKETKTFTDKDTAVAVDLTKKIKNIQVFEANALDDVRYKRVEDCLVNYDFSYNDLKDLFVNEGFEIFSQKIDGMRSEIKNEVESARLKDLEDLEKEKQNLAKEKDGIISSIEKLNSEKEKIQTEISEAKIELESLNANYDSVLLQLKVGAKINAANQPEQSGIIKPLAFEIGSIGKPFAELKSEGLDHFYLVEKNLNRIGYGDNVLNLYKNEKDTLLSAHAAFIPCVSWAYIYAQSIGNAKVYTMHIEHDWLHYRDFCGNGLLEIWENAAKDNNTNYILTFEDLNLTQPECGMTPLLDLINGYRPFLEGTPLGLLPNMKIFATIIPFQENGNVGLKLSKRQFVSWGTFAAPDKPEYNVPVKVNTSGGQYGYFSPGDFSYQPQTPGDSYFE
jgi:hypothetical protein